MSETNLQIGDTFELLMDCMGNAKGSIGYVYEVYEDLKDKGEQAVQIIFENREYCGFSHDEMGWLIKYSGHDKRFENYQWQNVYHLWKDFQKGYWSWTEPEKLN